MTKASPNWYISALYVLFALINAKYYLDKKTMENKEILMEIYKVEAEKYNKTRDIQWKMNIAVWTVLIVAIYVKAAENVKLNYISPGVEDFVCAMYIGMHLFFVVQISESTTNSLNRMYNIVNELLRPTGTKLIKWDNIEVKKVKMSFIWVCIQLVITIFLIGIYRRII